MVDVTHMAKTNLNTGIQRVVRALLKELEVLTSDEIDVEPVVLLPADGFWHFQYVECNPNRKSNIVVPREGDLFLGLDLNAQIISAQKAGLFEDWKSRGAQIVITVHDILPIEHPEWWPEEVSVNHAQWLNSVLLCADTILSVSKATQNAVVNWCENNNIEKQHIKFRWFHLGADFEATNSSTGVPQEAEKLIKQLKKQVTFLSVGTIEPRKGHEQCLDAFESLWEQGLECNLVFVGKQGWLVDKLIKRLNTHPALKKHFFWLDGISDEYLSKVYASSDCLIAASNGEGFGIPLIEAARHGLPIIARDIPVFREVVGNNAHYFSGQSAEDLAKSVTKWLDDFEHGNHITSSGIKWQSWQESALQIQRVLRF
ncbi:MAG: glycosyltransferase family 4 protein [Methylophaga sp.]|nr:glycosyltransferase family 4 protein [Methylophaga sp.]